MADFCPYCGSNLTGTEKFCPECGAPLGIRTQAEEREQYPDYVYLAYLCGGCLSTFFLTYFIGFYFLFLFIPLVFIGGRQSRFSMLLIGAMFGTLAGYAMRFLI